MQARFRISGYLTDSGGMPAAEYQRQLAAAENHAEFKRTGAGVAPAVAMPMQTTQLEVTSLTSSMTGAAQFGCRCRGAHREPGPGPPG
jgi:hypothetical protein